MIFVVVVVLLILLLLIINTRNEAYILRILDLKSTLFKGRSSKALNASCAASSAQPKRHGRCFCSQIVVSFLPA